MSTLESVIDQAKQVLSARVASHTVHTSNIANLETPNYKARTPHFSIVLDKTFDAKARQVGGTSASRWKTAMKTTESKVAAGKNGNNVQLHQEISAMTQNSIQYMSTLKILNKIMGITRYAITSGEG